jgi:hypothetical protein
MDTQAMAFIFAMVVFSIFISLLFRRVIWWYWGIDKHLANQQKIIDTLSAQIELQKLIADQEARRRAQK